MQEYQNKWHMLLSRYDSYNKPVTTDKVVEIQPKQDNSIFNY